MITIKLKIQNKVNIQNYQKQYNNIVRFAYNKLKLGLTQAKTEQLVKNTMNNIKLMDASFIKAATDSARSLNLEQKVIFGGKKNWINYNKGLISKQEYQNTWRRNKIVNNLIKRCNIIGIVPQEIIAQYSSFIGQIDNEKEYDSIAAAIELGRRGLLYISKYYYKENINIQGKIIGIDKKLDKDLMDRWKKKLNYLEDFDSYKALYDRIKVMKYSYRNLFQFDWFCFRHKSIKSKIFIYFC